MSEEVYEVYQYNSLTNKTFLFSFKELSLAIILIGKNFPDYTSVDEDSAGYPHIVITNENSNSKNKIRIYYAKAGERG